MVIWNWKVLKCQDLPKFQFGGGVFWNWKVLKCQDLPKFCTQYSVLYSVLRLGLSDNFHWGGTLKLKSLKVPRSAYNFNFWGWGILYSDLDSLTIFIFGGYSVLGLGLWQFSFSGGVFCTRTWTLWQFSLGEGEGVFYRIGVNCRIWTKISTTPAGSCITDSLSHTYVCGD